MFPLAPLANIVSSLLWVNPTGSGGMCPMAS